MNPDLSRLHPYPFEKLSRLKSGVTPPELAHIALSIGEPKHPAPDFVLRAIQENLRSLSAYPLTRGSLPLRQSIADWLVRRFQLQPDSIDPEQNVLPVNGTREALFSFAQACIDRSHAAQVLMPNPFYQIYEGAAILAGAEPVFLNTVRENNFLPDFDSVSPSTWQKCQLVYVCSPGNPTGAVLDETGFSRLLDLADQYNFTIASDECYSEIYFDETNPPAGLLSVAAARGNNAYKRCVVFHSLSKRSNLPGLRSGFVAGDAEILQKFLTYRTYHGCAMSPAFQAASQAAWSDEEHVITNRLLYKSKFDAVVPILSEVLEVTYPEAGFYLWPNLPIDDQEFCKQLFAQQHVTVLPGSFLSRDSQGANPGQNYARLALVAPLEECVEAANRIKSYIQTI